MNVAVYFVAAMILLGLVLFSIPKEKFQPEFLDKRQVDKTVAVQDSSYRQVTNHFEPSPFSLGPIAGMETPFQVNQYKAYVV